MSVSYNKQVTFLVQEGEDAPRPATEEDFRRAGFVLVEEAATSETKESAPNVSDEHKLPENEDYDLNENVIDFDELDDIVRELFLNIGSIANLSEIPTIAALFNPLMEWVDNSHEVMELIGVAYEAAPENPVAEQSAEPKPSFFPDACGTKSPCNGEFDFPSIPPLVSGLLGDLLEDTAKVIRFDELKGHVSGILDPFKFVDPNEQAAAREKSSPVEDIAGDLFNGAFKVFNSVKDGLSGLLDPIEYPETQKRSSEEKSTPSEPSKEVFGDEYLNLLRDAGAQNTEGTPEKPETTDNQTSNVEKPEFTVFEQSIIDMFEEKGLGADAKAAMRKSKEFTDFLSSSKPTPEQVKMFSDLFKNGKPPFFGG